MMTQRTSARSFRKVLLSWLIIVSVFLMIAMPAVVNAQPVEQAGFAMIWADEFEGAGAVDSANGWYDIGTHYPGTPDNGWGTGEIESMTNSTSNVFRDGAGHLVIKAIHTGTNPATG